jgi:hypothetical protein
MEKELSGWLKQGESETLIFRGSHEAIKGFPNGGFRSDGMLTDGRTLIAIEVEAGQTHPDTNVGKYWILYQNHFKYQNTILFHIYTPNFNSYGWRKNLAEFYSTKMKAEMPFEYVLKDYRQAKNFEDTVSKIKESINSRLKLEFGLSLLG